MAYTVRTTSVAGEVERFARDPDLLRYWHAVLDEISANPFPRFGHWTEEIAPIRSLPMRTFNYEITEEVGISGERIYAFVSEFVAIHVPVTPLMKT